MIGWIGDKLRRLPPWGLGLVAVAAVGLIVGGAIAGYQTYDWVEHDNEFCLSCHLMVEPYELFARSAHRDLGCKACHKPSFAARSQMAISQIVVNPDSIRHHAEVENEKCTACHIDGDPERWETIRNSAGHRIHLESSDPTLEGFNCVECHSTSLHQFTAATETCAQSGCHTDSGIQLGGMSDLTIHCTACHGFSDPVPEGTDLAVATAAVQPDAQECLSCHAMRVLVSMPQDEPHNSACGACHNPHEQATPAEAVETCATADCHSQPDELTPMHRGLDPGVLESCTRCHGAHDWNADAENCLACHQDILRNGGGTVGRPVASASASPGAPAAPDARDRLRVRRAGLIHPEGPGVSDPASDRIPRAVQATDTTFRHATHRDVRCTSCHSTEVTHGQVTVVGLRDCRSCHHTAPVASDCAACHVAGATPGATYRVTRTLDLSVGTVRGRQIDFAHGPHDEVACSSCHTAGLALAATDVDCASCHEDHHTPEVSCRSCHARAPSEAHPVEVHRGCTGSGCHENVAADLRGVPRTRPFCLSCHQDLVDHRPGQNCEECHRLPAPAGGGITS